MKENGGINIKTNNKEKKTKTNTSFHAEEPPPDPDDFGTKEEEIKNKELLAHLLEQQKWMWRIFSRTSIFY